MATLLAGEFHARHFAQCSTASSKGKAPATQRLITWPPGERNKHWTFKKGVQLEDDDEEHRAILSTARALTLQCGLNYQTRWQDQPRKQLNLCFDHLQATHPYLLQFEDDWATREYVHNALDNWRKMARQQLAKKQKHVASEQAGSSGSGSATISNDADNAEDGMVEDEEDEE